MAPTAALSESEALHIVVAAGFNYSEYDTAPHYFDEQCMNRIAFWLARPRQRPVVFHLISVGHGAIARSIVVDPGFSVSRFLEMDKSVARDAKKGSAQRFWRDVKWDPFVALTSKDFRSNRGGGRYPAYVARGLRHMSILDIYGHLATLPRGSVLEASIFSHSKSEGPILVNSYESSTFVYVPRLGSFETIPFKDSLTRDPGDLDARYLKDFYVPAPPPGSERLAIGDVAAKYVSLAEATHWFYTASYTDREDTGVRDKIATRWQVSGCAEAFHPKGYLWIWGCNRFSVLKQMLTDVEKAWRLNGGAKLPAELVLDNVFSFDGKTGQLLEDEWTLNTEHKRVETAAVLRVFEAQYVYQYGAVAAFALGVPCVQSFPAISTGLSRRPRGRFPLMNVLDDLIFLARFWHDVLGYPQYSSEFPYAVYVPIRGGKRGAR